MRLRPGRPDLGRYAGLFAVPPAAADAPLSVTWLGGSTLLIDDGESAVLTDGFFSRPGLARVGLGRIAPSAARIDGCLARAGVRRLAAVLPVHTHYDHALDSAVVAERTGATLIGGESAANVGRGRGLPLDIGACLLGLKDCDWSERTLGLEQQIEQRSPGNMPEVFVLQGQTPAGAALHLARTATRRAERRCVSALRQSGREVRLGYLNRLSELLYVMALRAET